jgi:hypothetical protein
MRWYRGPSYIYAAIIRPYARSDISHEPIPPDMAKWTVPCWNLRRGNKPYANASTPVRLTANYKRKIALLDTVPQYEYIPGIGVRTKSLYKLETK